MTAGTYSFTIEQGSTFRRSITLTDVDNQPIPLVGKKARMQIRDTQPAPTVLLEMSSDTGEITLIDPGQIVWFLGADQTATFTWKKGVYDMEIYDPADPKLVERTLQGQVLISPEVTR